MRRRRPLGKAQGRAWTRRAAGLTVAALLSGCGADPEPPAGSEPADPAPPIQQAQPAPEPSAEDWPDHDPDEFAAARIEIAKLATATSEDELRKIFSELSWIRHPVAVEPIAALLVADERPAVADAAIDALEDIGTPEAVRAMGRVFPLEGREETKLRAVEGIRWIGFDARDDAVAELIRALADPSDEVRRMASAALASLEEPAVVAQLYAAYQDPATDARARGALAVLLRSLGESTIPAP